MGGWRPVLTWLASGASHPAPCSGAPSPQAWPAPPSSFSRLPASVRACPWRVFWEGRVPGPASSWDSLPEETFRDVYQHLSVTRIQTSADTLGSPKARGRKFKDCGPRVRASSPVPGPFLSGCFPWQWRGTGSHLPSPGGGLLPEDEARSPTAQPHHPPRCTLMLTGSSPCPGILSLRLADSLSCHSTETSTDPVS